MRVQFVCALVLLIALTATAEKPGAACVCRNCDNTGTTKVLCQTHNNVTYQSCENCCASWLAFCRKNIPVNHAAFVSPDVNKPVEYTFAGEKEPPTQAAVFRSVAGTYLAAAGGGGSSVECRRSPVGASEVFDLIDLNGGALTSGDRVNLRTRNGTFVVAESGGNAQVNADRSVAGPWGTFTIVKVGRGTAIAPGDSVAFRASRGTYLAANDDEANIMCSRTSIGRLETFTYIKPQVVKELVPRPAQ